MVKRNALEHIANSNHKKIKNRSFRYRWNSQR